jgi:hypothetical protein
MIEVKLSTFLWSIPRHNITDQKILEKIDLYRFLQDGYSPVAHFIQLNILQIAAQVGIARLQNEDLFMNSMTNTRMAINPPYRMAMVNRRLSEDERCPALFGRSTTTLRAVIGSHLSKIHGRPEDCKERR